MVFHERVLLIMVTMSRPGNYDLSDLMYVLCGMTLPFCLHINIFDLSAAKELKVVNTSSLEPMFEFTDDLGQAACHKCSPF